MFYELFEKNFSSTNTSDGAIKGEIVPNHCPWDLPGVGSISHGTQNQWNNYRNNLLETMKNKTYNSSFNGNVWDTDLADMKLISNYNKFFFLLCAIDIYRNMHELFL